MPLPVETPRLSPAIARAILDEVAMIRNMNGYTEPDERGHDASVWLGTSLHNIETLASAILNHGSEPIRP